MVFCNLDLRYFLCLGLTSCLLEVTQGQTTYTYPNGPSTNVPGLQQDSTGRVFVSAGDRLFRLSPDLALEESLTLPAEVVSRGVSLSGDGGSVVVCLTDLSCSVYNATNLAAGPLRVANNSIASADFGVAVFTAGDAFYTGSVSGETRMVLQQNGEGFTRSSDNNPIDDQYIFGTAFSRDFYGGFERDGFAYYFVADYNPIAVRGFRMLRVCNMPDCGGADTCGVTALYEGQFSCGPTPGLESRICGVSLLEGFDGISDPIAVVSISQPGTTRNFICYVNITAANEAMDGKYDSCKTPPIDPSEEVDLVWERDTFCSQVGQGTSSRCDFTSALGVDSLSSTFEVDVGSNVITASVAVIVESFSFVYVGTVNGGTNTIFGYDVGSSSVRLFSSQYFYSGPVDSTVQQMSCQQGQDYITVATTDNVFQLPIEECSSHIDCVSCTAETNPLCGWCVVENKCSRQSQCQNANLTSTVRWTQDNTNCITASVSPNQFVLDMPANLTVTLNSPGLPAPLPNETFSCHLATSEGMFPAIVVPAIEVTPRTVYTCDIQGMVPDYMGVTAVINLSFVSSLIDVPFDTTNGALAIYRCNGIASCSECLQTNSPCGWCNYNKVCSGTNSPCRNTSNFLQLSGNTFQSLCPLLDQPPSGNYVQPVRVNEDIQLITANLPPPDDGFQYRCEVNGVSLTAVYENGTSITCTVPANDLVLSGDVGSSSVVAKVIWFGNGIEHPIDNVMEQTNVNLYDCRELAMGCSSCIGANLGSGFMCGWCGSTCEVNSECTNSFVTNGNNCPNPVITTFTPTTGPVEGGTVITVTGSDLGVTFSDIETSLLLLGGFPCTPINRDYISGSQFLCETTVFTNGAGSKGFVLTIGSRTTTPPSETFRAVVPEITEINPTFGPIAGGTMVTVNGTGLNVGNQEDTVVYFNVNGITLNCIIAANSILSGSIRCQTSASNQTTSAQVVVGIDNARVTSPSVMFSYRSNPNVTSVSPQNTIPSGGISLMFTGEDLDVVQTPVLEINLPGGDTVMTDCTVENSMTISCITPNISTSVDSLKLEYSLIFDGAIDSAQIAVQSDPSNFQLEGNNEINVGTPVIINIQGDNLDSVVPNEITVMVGSEQCVKLSETTILSGGILCTAPAVPPNGQSEAEVRVLIGTNINILLDTRLTYISSTDVPLGIIIPIVLVILAIPLIIICCLAVMYSRKKMPPPAQFNLEMTVDGKTVDEVFSPAGLFQSQIEEMLKTMPDSLKIPSSQLKLSSTAIGQGEFGVVYKAVLVDWNKVPAQGVAVKTLKGLFSPSDIQSMLSEIVKMQNFHHRNVMSLIGVCMDAGPGVSIVMPYMANGSLLDYLKKERGSLELDDDSEIDQILSVRKLLLRMCHQVCLGMVYLTKQMFIHRDLAARNCMLDRSGDIKVGDFGLAEDVYSTGYFRQTDRQNVKLPFKWMALESLNDAIFTEKTDVWSYGVTVWEIFSAGRTPYPAVDPMSLITLLREGRRLERPTNAACATEISAIMRKCWRVNPDDRPDFTELCSLIERLSSSVAGYTELSMDLPPVTEDEEFCYDYVQEVDGASGPRRYEVPVNITDSIDYGTSDGMVVTENTAYGTSDGMVVTENTAYGTSDGMVITENTAYGTSDGMVVTENTRL